MDIYNIHGTLLYKNVDIKDLKGMNLKGANLKDANLEDANLKDADLKGANFQGADLQGAYLYRANLQGANLYATDLKNADLREADFKGTCLDPLNRPNMEVSEFEVFESRNGMKWCVGYRSGNSKYIDPTFNYKIGKLYEAPYFSISNTACHPGLYVNPHYKRTMIKVIFPDYVLHRVKGKYRVKWFIVIGLSFDS